MLFRSPIVPPNPPSTGNTPQPDYGVRLFAEVNASMSRVTGVPPTDSVVAALYASEQQSLPAVPQINAYTASEQTAVSELAGAYCGELVNNQGYRDAFFGTGLDASISSGASFFSGATNQNIVIIPLANAIVGVSTDPAYAGLQSELSALLTRIPSVSSGATVAMAAQAACQAALGSAALTIK